MMPYTSREERGREIASLEGTITRVDVALYEVKSQSGHGNYDVFQDKAGWACSCPDNEFRNVKCKHIWAVEFSLAFKEEVVGWGNGDVQILLVKCHERFREPGFHRKRVCLNHVAFRAESKDDVDRFYKDFLVPRRVKVLYDGPREYPEYGPGYHAVYFEDPDRLKLEFVHGIE